MTDISDENENPNKKINHEDFIERDFSKYDADLFDDENEEYYDENEEYEEEIEEEYYEEDDEYDSDSEAIINQTVVYYCNDCNYRWQKNTKKKRKPNENDDEFDYLDEEDDDIDDAVHCCPMCGSSEVDRV